MALARELGDRALEGWLLTELAISTAVESDDPAVRREAIRQCQAIIDIFTELDDKPGLANGYNLLGEVLRLDGDYEEARRVYEIALALSEETGELNRQSLVRANLSFVAYRLGEFEEARDLAVVLLRDRYASGMRAWFLIDLAVLAAPLGQLGQPEMGARLLGASAAIMAEIGAPYQPSDQEEIDLYIRDIRALLDEDAFAAAWDEGAAMSYAQVVAYVQADQ